MIPSVQVRRLDFQTGNAGPSTEGVLAIIAPATSGPTGAFSYTRDSTVAGIFGAGPLTEDASYAISQSGKPVLVVRAPASTAATYGTVTKVGTGTAVISAGSTAPADDYDALITWVAGGTVGAAGITYTFSLDGGTTTSAVQKLPEGTAPIVLTIPAFSNGSSPGVSFSVAAGTVVAGDTLACSTKHARMTNSDLTAALEILRVTNTPYEAIYVDQEVDSATVGLLDAWLQTQEGIGKFKLAFANTPLKASGVTEADYLTAMTSLVEGSAHSIRLSLGTDGGDVTSTLTGLTHERPAALITAARSMGIPLGVEPAYVALGALGNVKIDDGTGNPLHHDELLYPGLDDLLLTTLRSVPGQVGVFVCNGRVFSSSTSDYQLIPQARTMNRGLEIAYATLTTQLNAGVGKKPPNPDNTVNMLERDRRKLQGLVNTALAQPLKGQVAGYQFTVASDDDIGSNGPGLITSTLAISSLVYVKTYRVVSLFVRSFTVGVGA